MAAPALAYAQNQEGMKDKKDHLAYSCRALEASPDGNMVILRNDVNIKSENLTLHADSAVISHDHNTWIVYGTKELKFEKAFTATIMSNNMTQYSLGEDMIYVLHDDKKMVIFR